MIIIIIIVIYREQYIVCIEGCCLHAKITNQKWLLLLLLVVGVSWHQNHCFNMAHHVVVVVVVITLQRLDGRQRGANERLCAL